MTTSPILWLLSAIIPLVMATYMSGQDNNGDIVRDLVQQVRDLQVTVNQQGKRIEDLELRLVQKEVVEDTEVPESDNDHPGSENDNVRNSISGHATNGQFSSPGELPLANSGKLNRGIRSDTTVAFSVYLDKRLSHLGLGQTVKFDGVLYNDGNHYNIHTGVFTAPATGVYMFSYFIVDDVNGNVAAVRLMVDDVHEVDAIARALSVSGRDNMRGNSAILLVNAGQAVWLQITYKSDAELYSREDLHMVTFSGFLI